MTTDTLKEPVLTKVPRGHWRNVYKFLNGRSLAKWNANDVEWLDEYCYYGKRKWPCKDSAETSAMQSMAGATPVHLFQYCGAEFFPGA